MLTVIGERREFFQSQKQNLYHIIPRNQIMKSIFTFVCILLLHKKNQYKMNTCYESISSVSMKIHFSFQCLLYVHFPLRAPNLYYVYCRLRIWCCIRGYATFLEIQSTQIKMLNALFLVWLCKLVHLLSFKRGCNNGFDQLPSSIELYVYKLRIKPFHLQ